MAGQNVEIPHVTPYEVLDRTAVYREHFGLTDINPERDPTRFAQACDQLNPRFQGERDLVRFEMEQDTQEFPVLSQGIIRATAAGLDMHRPGTPLVGEFDTVLNFAAARKATWDRVHYAAEAIASGKATGHLVMGGSIRPLRPGEAEAAGPYAPEGATTEEDMVDGAAAKIEEVFGFTPSKVIVRDENAGTPDVLRATIERLGLRTGQKLVGVTTQIYRVFTDLDCQRVGGQYGIETAVAANPSDPAIVAKRTDTTYHSEILRTLRAAANNLAS